MTHDTSRHLSTPALLQDAAAARVQASSSSTSASKQQQHECKQKRQLRADIFVCTCGIGWWSMPVFGFGAAHLLLQPWQVSKHISSPSIISCWLPPSSPQNSARLQIVWGHICRERTRSCLRMFVRVFFCACTPKKKVCA
jgi:hypothetical protein